MINQNQTLQIQRWASPLVISLSIALLTTTALTNISMLALVLLSIWAWRQMEWSSDEWALIKPLFIIIGLFCLWDLLLNLVNGNSLIDSLQALRHVRKFFFVLVLWPLFSIPKVTRHAILALVGTVTVLAIANLFWTLVLHNDDLMTSFMPNMHGQILVGAALLCFHAALHQPRFKWVLFAIAAILLSSLFFASTRRTGYILLGVGGVLLLLLELLRQPKARRFKYLFIGFGVLSILLITAFLSPKVQSRMTQMLAEYQQFFDMTPAMRSQLATSVGLRLQYVFSSWLIISDHFWTGVGSLNFKPLFWEVNKSLGATNPIIFAPNPHNEYMYMWATKGLIGLILYLSIFAQACRIAAHRLDVWQREGLWILVCLFLVSILFNSMSIDMVEGHFMMLVLLMFLAPSHIWSANKKIQGDINC